MKQRGDGRVRQQVQLRVVLMGVAAVVLLPLLVWGFSFLHDGRLPHTRIGGVLVPSNRPLTAFLQAQAASWAQQTLTLQTGYHVWRPSRAELGAELPVEEARIDIQRLGRSPNPFVSLSDWWVAWIGDGHAVRWQPHIQQATLNDYVMKIRAKVDRAPTPGSFDPEGKPIAGLPGEAIDVESTTRAIQSAIARGVTELEVATIVSPPPRTFRRFPRPSNDASVLMMRQETEFRPGNNGRSTNIELAAHKLDGVVMMPGAPLSFNAVVGKRELSRGFAPALELINGEVAPGVGGGVCQVAGTLHAAAFFAGLIVEEYRPHSRLNQFAYLRPGLDTMVAWPDHVNDLSETKDMRIRNPYPFPVQVKTQVLDRPGQTSILRVELYGAERPFRVDWSFEEVDHVPASEVRRADASLPTGRERVQQEALQGIVIMRRRTIYTPTRRIEEETRVAYPPTPRVILVGSG